MGTWTIASTFEISVGTVTGVDITVDYLAGRDAEAGGGDVTGPASAVDENIAVFNSTTGKLIKDGLINKSAITANTAKVTNATHTGEVTGSGALTVDPTAISNKTLKSTLAGTEEILINDTTLKKTTAQDIANLGNVTSGVGSANIFYLDTTASLADNYTLSISPSAYAQTINTKAVTSATSPNFFERFISQPLGRSSIPGGSWEFNIYGATSNNSGTNEIKYRINKRVAQTGMTCTFTGAGATRTVTVTGGTPFVAGDANADRMLASLIETPTQTGWITAFTSSSVVTVYLTDVAFVNVSNVEFSAMYYFLFQDSTGDITGSSPADYTTVSVQPEFTGLGLTDRILIALFASTDQAGSRNISLYYGGTENYTHFHSPLTTLHNDLAGLQGGTTNEYYHLTSAQATVVGNTSGTNTGDQVGDGSTITGAGTVGSPFVSAGGTQYQNYDINFWTDLADATNWQGIYGLSLSTNLPDEYSVGYIVTKANPAIGVAASKLRDIRILGMARANQTVIKLRMFTPSTVTGNHIDRISIFKVKWLNASNFTYITNLYEGNVTWSSDGHYEVLAAAFAVTTISEKDSIYVALGGTATTDIGTYIMQLTCSI